MENHITPPSLVDLRRKYEENDYSGDGKMRLSDDTLQAMYGENWRMHQRRDLDWETPNKPFTVRANMNIVEERMSNQESTPLTKGTRKQQYK